MEKGHTNTFEEVNAKKKHGVSPFKKIVNLCLTRGRMVEKFRVNCFGWSWAWKSY